MRSKILTTVNCLLLITFLSGCAGGPSSYFRREPLSPDKHVTVAIVPFVNFAPHKDADRKVAYNLITHLLKTNYFNVVEMGETQKALKEARARKGDDLSHEQIKRIGQLTGADVLLMGVVEEYKIDSSTMLGEKVFVPEVSISVRLVSTRDGSIIWAANHHRRGDDRVTIFGMGRIDSISLLTDVIITDTVKALVRAMKNRKNNLAVFKQGAVSPVKATRIAAPVPESPGKALVEKKTKSSSKTPEDPKKKTRGDFKDAYEDIKRQY